jgi:hypothetical protein
MSPTFTLIVAIVTGGWNGAIRTTTYMEKWYIDRAACERAAEPYSAFADLKGRTKITVEWKCMEVKS